MGKDEKKTARAVQTIKAGKAHTKPAPASDGSLIDAIKSGDANAETFARLYQLVTSGADMDEDRVRAIAKEEAENAAPAAIERVVYERVSGERSDTGDAIVHEKFKLLLRICSTRMANGFYPNVMVVGPSATGKTHACEQIAKLMGIPFYIHNKVVEDTDLIGYVSPDGTYQTKPFVTAYEDTGGFVLLDEYDAGEDSGLMPVQSALANGILNKPGTIEPVRRHKDFLCVASCNTYGRGATLEHSGRNKIDGASLSRFAIKVAWGYDQEMERRLIEKFFPNDDSDAWRYEIQSVRHYAIEQGMGPICDMRTMIDGAGLLSSGMDLDTVRSVTYLAGLDDDASDSVLRIARSAN